MQTAPSNLSEFLASASRGMAQAEALSALLLSIAQAAKSIAALTTRGPLLGVTGKLASQNVQGETQMHLDVLSNAIFMDNLKQSGVVAGLASEEMDAPVDITQGGPFLVVFDPLDGSSNVAVNVSIGSIFSVLNAPKTPLAEADYLQAGNQQVAAGYALYGYCTMLVLTLGQGTHGFTLDPDNGEFYLTHPGMRVPEETAEFAINASNQRFWDAATVDYVEGCLAGATGPRGKDFNMRWVASMVADVHRILIRGGVYVYAQDSKEPARGGRLRLMYEVNPMSMLVEQAGGKSTTGRQRLLDVQPNHIHQRVPVILGSHHEVAFMERCYAAVDGGVLKSPHSPLFSGRSLFHKKTNH
ncbi:Fbp Fructose-1,6-bisphosphatase [Methylophilaceae bacterium]